MKAVIGAAVALVLLLSATLLPLPVRPYLDFQVLYQADLGLLRGVPVYDHAGQVAMIAQLANARPEDVFVLPFPYPPWYALVTAWLALAPIEVAARVWFGLNLIMLGLALWLLTDGLSLKKRLLLASLAIVFPPVLGSLFVGQYAFPVLLGAALLAWTLRRRSTLALAASTALLTFKPHLGGLILVMVVVYLWLRRDEGGRRGLLAIAVTAAALFVLGFVASPAWPTAYFHSLTGFQGVPGVLECTQCVSLPAGIATAVGGGRGAGVIAAVVLLIVLTAWLASRWHWVTGRPERLIAAGALLTLLISPYLLNYDYVMLLVPFTAVAYEARGITWTWLALAYGLPLIGLSLFGAAGNMVLVVSALILFVALVRVASPPDVKAATQSARAGDPRV